MNKRNVFYALLAMVFFLAPATSHGRWMNPNTGRFQTMDTYEGSQTDPPSLHKYLCVADNPVNLSDPTGHDGDEISLMASDLIATSLASMYNGGVATVGNALQATIVGVQNQETESAILGGYLKNVAIGVAIGVGIGAVADIAGDLIFGGNVEGEAVSVEVNGVNTAQGSREFASVESSTADLVGAAGRAAKVVKAETGLTKGAVYGIKVHSEFANDVEAMGLNSEVSYLNGKPVNYGTPGSVRLDVVKGPKNAPQAIWDLKTGSAKLTQDRIQQIRRHLPPGCQDIPIAEIRP